MQRSVISCTSAEAKPYVPFAEARDSILEMVSDISSKLDILESKYSPVIKRRDPDPDKTSATAPEPLCEYEEFMDALHYRLGCLSWRVQDIYERSAL